MREISLADRLERSQSNESVDLAKYQSINKQDPLVRVLPTDKILVQPVWEIPGDFEGGMYADFIAEHPTYDGIYVRSELLIRINEAANHLPSPYQLVVRAGHRPIDVQKRLLKECAADYIRDNPGTTDEEALRHARMFCSDPDITLPPHVCGAAVDVEIMDSTTGKLLDFGNKMNDDNEKSFLYAPDISAEAKANRLMLVTAMLRTGLVSCKTEWWHYSYGDQLWAWFYGEENSLYSPIDL